MSTVETTKCDACGASIEKSSYSLPYPWVRIQVRQGTEKEHHACSSPCAARVFYKLADAHGGIRPTGDADPKTGQPYR